MRARSTMVFVLGLVASALGCGGCGKAASSGPGEKEPGRPVETRAPNGKDQTPAFPGQTRAPFATAGVRFDVLLAPSFAADGLLFFSYAERREGGNGTAIARARLVLAPSPRLEDVKVIWRVTPTLASGMHFGGRLVLARDGTLFVTSGERSILEGRRQAQRLDSAFGKVVRIRPDGSAPPDNPFVDRPGALRELFSIGHRNPQAAARCRRGGSARPSRRHCRGAAPGVGPRGSSAHRR